MWNAKQPLFNHRKLERMKCENFLGEGHGVLSEDGHAFALEVGEHMRARGKIPF